MNGDPNEPLVLPSAIHRFMKKPALLVTESRRDYDALFEDIVRTIDPGNTLEWLSTCHYFECQWGIRRQRQAKAAIINATRHEALRTILESILPQSDDRLELAARLADEWFERPQERAAIIGHLGKHDLDDDAISAQAMAMRARDLEIIDKELQRLAIMSMAHLREIEFLRVATSWCASEALGQGAGQMRLLSGDQSRGGGVQ